MKNIQVVVKKDFLDRYTGIKHKAGKRLAITEARYLEIKRSGDYVEVAKPAPIKKEEK